MGIRHLETFIRQDVPNGCVPINMAIEIQKYYSTANNRNLPPPIIVIDLMSLYQPITKRDLLGLLCGGRYNQVALELELFFTKLVSLGVKLVFFYDGPIQQIKYDTWAKRQNEKYHKMIEIIDHVDRKTYLRLIRHNSNIFPSNTTYPLKNISIKYGEFIVSIAKECDQELATYANKVGAFAIISNDTDFMIFKGMWRYWSAKCINFQTLDTEEYSRINLVRQLNLRFEMMPLLATLGGNDFIKYEEVRHFHSKLGSFREKFFRLADFVRKQFSPARLHDDQVLHTFLSNIFGRAAVNNDLKERFIGSLDFYCTDNLPPNNNIENDALQATLCEQKNTFLLQLWNGIPINVTNFFVDMRKGSIGEHYPQLVIPMLMRQAGICLFHKQMLSDCSTFAIVIKMSHENDYSLETLPVEFPNHISPPPLLDLLSKQKDVKMSLQDKKMQLYAWIASDNLDHHRLTSVPDKLLSTVVTLYYLVEKHVLDILEADILLLVAHAVVFETYDIQSVQYPASLQRRPFLISFIYQKILNHFSKARTLLGFDEDVMLYFDGVLFHKYYSFHKNQPMDLEHIKQWRIYDGLVKQ